jgi:hypothetical protein
VEIVVQIEAKHVFSTTAAMAARQEFAPQFLEQARDICRDARVDRRQLIDTIKQGLLDRLTGTTPNGDGQISVYMSMNIPPKDAEYFGGLDWYQALGFSLRKIPQRHETEEIDPIKVSGRLLESNACIEVTLTTTF